MEIIQGTTPTLVITVNEDLDFSMITEAWIYIAQQNKVKIDKTYTDVTFNQAAKTLSVLLSQEDTLNVKDGEAIFQMRLLLSDGTALGVKGKRIDIVKTYKGGIIKNG